MLHLHSLFSLESILANLQPNGKEKSLNSVVAFIAIWCERSLELINKLLVKVKKKRRNTATVVYSIYSDYVMIGSYLVSYRGVIREASIKYLPPEEIQYYECCNRCFSNRVINKKTNGSKRSNRKKTEAVATTFHMSRYCQWTPWHCRESIQNQKNQKQPQCKRKLGHLTSKQQQIVTNNLHIRNRMEKQR